MSGKWTGGCQCGEIRYEIDPAAVHTMYACHCRDCQRQSAAAFGISVIVNRTGFELVEGEVKTWETHGDSGAAKRANFCPNCGVRIFHDGDDGSAWISVKGGTLDDNSVVKPGKHLWTKRMQPWLELADDLPRLDGEPAPEDDPYVSGGGGG